MRTPEEIYHWLVTAPDRVIAVSILSDDELLRVSGWLGLNYQENATTGAMLGICLVERSDRWANEIMKTKESGKDGER